MRPLFRRVEEGIEFRFPAGLAEWLRDLPRLLDEVGDDPGDPATSRLQVPVYLDDPSSNDEWWGLMGSELDQARQADRSAFQELVDASVKGTVASPEEAEAFLRVLVEGRLVLGARLGVEVESDYENLGEQEASILQALAELQVLLLRELGPG